MSSTPDQLTSQTTVKMLSIITYRVLVSGKSVNPFLDFGEFFLQFNFYLDRTCPRVGLERN